MMPPQDGDGERNEAQRLLEKYKKLRLAETQVGEEKGLNQLKLSLWENDKGKSEAQQ